MSKVRFITVVLVGILLIVPIGCQDSDGDSEKESKKEIEVKIATGFEQDVFETNAGDLTIAFIGHGTLMFAHNGKIIHVDPYGKLGDYSKLPKADLILITHEHGDHLDNKAIGLIVKDDTKIVMSKSCESKATGIIMKNGDVREFGSLKIEAVPAYNIVHKRSDGNPFHPKGNGNGYIVAFGDKKVYIAGDTENIPEMKELKNIDIAFLPMNLPYTMTPEMTAEAAKSFAPAILYPYHFGQTDTSKLAKLLKDQTNIEVAIRKMN